MRWRTMSGCITPAINEVSLQSCRATEKARTPFCNDFRPSPTNCAMAHVSGCASSTSIVCGLLRRKASSRGASRTHHRRQKVRWGGVSEVEYEGRIDNIAECVVGEREDPENEAVSEGGASRPFRPKKRLQWWTVYVCGSDYE